MDEKAAKFAAFFVSFSKLTNKDNFYFHLSFLLPPVFKIILSAPGLSVVF